MAWRQKCDFHTGHDGDAIITTTTIRQAHAPLALDERRIVARRPSYRLTRVVHQDVQGLVPFRDERAERLDSPQIPQVQAVHLQTTAPLVRVGLPPCADACVRA